METISTQMLDALIRIGHLARNAGWSAPSQRLFEHLCHAYPLSAFPYVGIGLACVQTHRYAQGAYAFEQALALGDHSKDVHLWYGICQFRCGRYAKAAEVFRQLTAAGQSGGAGDAATVAQALLNVPELSAFRRAFHPSQTTR
jgi:tetratricopeptide (TPR) repeat protein